MSFSWTSVSAGTKIIPTHFNEAKTNTDTLCANLGISNYSWSELPVATAGKIEYDDLVELRNALDYVHDNNVCSSHFTTHNSTNRSGPHYSSYQNNVDTGHHGTHNSSYNNNVDTGFYGTYHGSHRSGPHYSIHYNTHRLSGHYTSVQATQRSSHMGSYRATPHNVSYS
jgi:hypothetical protein